MLFTVTSNNGSYSPFPKPKVGELSRLCPGISTKLYVHEFGFRENHGHCTAPVFVNLLKSLKSIPSWRAVQQFYLTYQPARLHRLGGIDSWESIPGLLKRLQIRAQYVSTLLLPWCLPLRVLPCVHPPPPPLPPPPPGVQQYANDAMLRQVCLSPKTCRAKQRRKTQENICSATIIQNY